MRVAAILTAAGGGRRLGHALPKALVPVAGVTLVVHAARGLAASGAVDEIVVTVPAGHRPAFAAALAAADLSGVPVTLVVGGATRQASVAAALAGLDPDVDVVLVHDAARALTPSSLVGQVVVAVRDGGRAVVPCLPVTDSLVDVADHEVRPVDRSTLRVVQTPQGFDRALLDRAHAAAGHRAGDELAAATDDASLCAALGEALTVIPGAAAAFKITTVLDLAVAEVLLGREAS